MKWVLTFLVLFVAVAWAEEELALADACDEEACQLPDCRCSSTNIPGGLNPRDVPQFVTVTFHGPLDIMTMEEYRGMVYNRVNSNGCPAGTTFFINHQHTNYQLVNELYNQGFEIALRSISHQPSLTYWAEASYEDMKQEIGDQKILMSHFANIPYDEIKGVRIPYLQMTGNASFQVMADYDLLYDSTWPTATQINPGLWPYTLDYASTQDCVTPPCPTAAIPGVWIFPMISWLDLDGVPCSTANACINPPDFYDSQAWFRFIVQNFERHYLGSRAPFGFYIHEGYLATYPSIRSAMIRFMTMINNMQDVFMVNKHEVIDWVKNPVPLEEYQQKPCRSFTPTTCPASTCGPLYSDHNPWYAYEMEACNVCPNTYPWLGNPLGQ